MGIIKSASEYPPLVVPCVTLGLSSQVSSTYTVDDFAVLAHLVMTKGKLCGQSLFLPSTLLWKVTTVVK